MNRISITIFLLLFTISSIAQKIKVEWVSGDVTINKKGTTTTAKLKNADIIDLGDRIYIGEKALLVVSDYAKKMFEVKKKGYVTGKELSESLLKTTDNEYQRYIAYILKELKSHESDMKASEKGIPGAPSRGDEFSFNLPDTIRMFDNEALPLEWTNSSNTESINLQLLTDKKTQLLDLDINGNMFWFNNIGTFFLVKKTLILTVFERKTDGNKILAGKTVIIQSEIKKADLEKQFSTEFAELADPRLNQIAQATKYEINHYYLKALEIYKILLLDYPEDELVKANFARFTQRTGLK
jgi:hypothetical protein